MRTRINYWTCSKLADWLRGTMKPRSETAEGWTSWHKEAKTNHPFRYWVAEEGLDIVQDIIYYVPDKFYEARCYLRNRYFDNTHALTSKLKRGQWYDMDTRLLHCIFDELVSFVEVEKAMMNHDWFRDNKKKRKFPCAEAGLAHLDWEINLKMNEDWGVAKTSPDYGKPTHQSEAAKEILALYTWWKIDRPKRPDPMDESGWSALCDERRKKDGNDDFLFTSLTKRTDEERAKSKEVLDLCHKIEEEQEKEDEEMLIRLIKIRKSLWT